MINMTYLYILEKWAIYSKYDRKQTKFNLCSNDYTLHKINKLIEMLLNEYDKTGMLAVIYAKIQFENLMKDIKISIWDILNNPKVYEQELNMYKLFNLPIVNNAENIFIEKLNNVYMSMAKDKFIGNNEKQQFFNSIETVVEQIDKCNVDLFSKGGKIGNITNINTKLHIFNTLAECLLAIEKAIDGLYFCFINAGQSADCFFSFFIKDNNNIISINDRIDETYIGQHQKSRNGRWAENKNGIFPYEYIFNYSEFDYKGYANKYKINENNLDLYNIDINVIMPIIISMLFITFKYSNKDIDLPLHYIDSFLPENQRKIENNKLMIINNSNIVNNHNINFDFDNNKILSGEYAEEFKENDYKENGVFSNINQLMVDLWGDGFVYNPNNIFINNNIHCLIDNNDIYIPEFVGTEKRMRLQAYKEIRHQLAEYINNKIYNEWINIGKTKPIKEWYKKSLLDNKEFLYKMFANYQYNVEHKNEQPVHENWLKTNGITIHIIEGTYPSLIDSDSIINCNIYDSWKYTCEVNNKICNLWFVVTPKNWKDIEYLTNKECPKIVKGWSCDGHRTFGNSILDVTDEVEKIQTPFEYKKWDEKYQNAYYNFKFAFGFSKSGWNKIKKNLKYDK